MRLLIVALFVLAGAANAGDNKWWDHSDNYRSQPAVNWYDMAGEASFATSSQNWTCNQMVEAADRYLGAGDEMGSQAHEVLCDHYKVGMLKCLQEFSMKSNDYNKIALFCTLSMVGYNEGKVAYARARRSSNSPREVVALHSVQFFYDNFQFDYTGRMELVKFHQRGIDQDNYDYENRPRNEVSYLYLRPSKWDLEEAGFRLKAYFRGYNMFRHFMSKNLPFDKLEVGEKFTKDLRINKWYGGESGGFSSGTNSPVFP